MKTKFFKHKKTFGKPNTIVVLMSCALLINTSQCFSQLALNEQHTNSASVITNKSANATASALNLKTVAPNIKVERSFISHFGEAAESNWSLVGKNFLNCFHLNGLLTRALFKKDGSLVYMIVYSTEKNLPADVRKTVKSEYYDYTITMVIEVKQDNRDIWVVQLDNTSEHITVRVENGEMDKVQQFQKTN